MYFRVMQVRRDGTNAAAIRRARWSIQQRRVRKVRVRRQHRRVGGSLRTQVLSVKVQRIQNDVVEGEHGDFRRRCFQQSSLPDFPGKAQTRLPVVVIGRTGGDDTVALETGTVGSLDGATLEGSRFYVIAQTVVDGEVMKQLPCVLHEEAVNIVFGSNGAGTGTESEGGCVGTVEPVLAKMELLEQREPGIVAYVTAELPGVLPMIPAQVIDVLVALVQTALRTAEVGAGDGPRRSVYHTRLRTFIRRVGERPYERKPGL